MSKLRVTLDFEMPDGEPVDVSVLLRDALSEFANNRLLPDYVAKRYPDLDGTRRTFKMEEVRRRIAVARAMFDGEFDEEG